MAQNLSSLENSTVLALVVVAFSAFGIMYTWSKMMRRRKLENTARSKASFAAAGFCELEGIVWPKIESMAGTNGTPLIYEEIVIEIEKKEKNQDGKDTTSWVTVVNHRETSLFYLIDKSGLVEINSSDIEFHGVNTRISFGNRLPPEERERIMNLGNIRSRVEEFFMRHNNSLLGLIFRNNDQSKIRYTITSIPVAGVLNVQGYFMPFDKPKAVDSNHDLFQKTKKTILNSIVNETQMKKIFDRNRDSKVTLKEITATLEGYALRYLKGQNLLLSDYPGQPDEAPSEDRIYGKMVVKDKKKIEVIDVPEIMYLKYGATLEQSIFWGSVLFFAGAVGFAIYNSFIK